MISKRPKSNRRGARPKRSTPQPIPMFSRLLILSLAFLSSCALSPSAEHEITKCTSLRHCAAAVESMEFESSHTNLEEVMFAKEFRKFGEPGLLYLIELLDSSDAGIAAFAAMGVSEFDKIDKKYLTRILAAIDRGVPRLSKAIGKIPTAEAARITVERYVFSKTTLYPGHALSAAVVLQGTRALPHIIDAALCDADSPEERMRRLSHVVGEMNDINKKKAADLIIKAMNAGERTERETARLLLLFTRLGEPGLFIESELVEIGKRRPNLSKLVDGAMIGIKSTRSGQIFANRLESDPNLLLLRDVAEVGPAAVEAGPAIIQLLSHPDMTIKVGAARALGFIRYDDAVSHLVAMLDDPRDVRLNWAAAASLGRIRDEHALAHLERVSKDHWYPEVRKAARQAITSIGTRRQQEKAYRQFSFEFFKYQHFDLESCDSVSLEWAPSDPELKIDQNSPENVRNELAYDRYDLFGRSSGDGNGPETARQIRQVPDAGLRVNTGWLVGSDRGEWGGELMYIPAAGTPSTLLKTNVQNIDFLGEEIVVVTGLAHLFGNSGMIFAVKSAGSGRWHVEPWIALPGAPTSSWLVETGELLVNTYGGGSILISDEGKLRMATCIDN